MKLTLSEKQFTLRCDMRALAAAKREVGIDLGKLSDDVVEIGTLVYYMAQSGAKHAGIPFKYECDDFLGLIEVKDLDALAEAVGALLGGGDGKKK
tara:strand:+ start:187 stop:471 length:285 start_codon:yes stop_codon:yes gene_type:complete